MKNKPRWYRKWDLDVSKDVVKAAVAKYTDDPAKYAHSSLQGPYLPADSEDLNGKKLVFRGEGRVICFEIAGMNELYFSENGGEAKKCYCNVKTMDHEIYFINHLVPGYEFARQITLMRTFITGSVPDAIIESAKIDGAGEGRILASIVLPVLKPGLATVGLFLALGYWNDWYRSSMFSTDKSTYELQFYLQNLVSASDAMKQLASTTASIEISTPTETVKMAMAVLVTGPILLVYPFVQRYFVSGITIGAVKG